jgi:hypothetical protein
MPDPVPRLNALSVLAVTIWTREDAEKLALVPVWWVNEMREMAA